MARKGVGLSTEWEAAKWARRHSLPGLARQIHSAARVAPQFIDPSRVFIAGVWDVLHAEGKTKLSLEQFKELLPILMRREYVVCTRADMVGVLDPSFVAGKGGKYGPRNELQKLLDRSETTYLGATWHLFATDR